MMKHNTLFVHFLLGVVGIWGFFLLLSSVPSVMALTPNSCMTQKPYFFDATGAVVANGCYGADTLVGTADDCGCPGGNACQRDGSCGVVCADGTNAGQCTREAPLYCSRTGILIPNATACGCPPLKPVMLPTGQCSAEQFIVDSGSSSFTQGTSEGLVPSQTWFDDLAYGKQVTQVSCYGTGGKPLTSGRAFLGTVSGFDAGHLRYCQIPAFATTPSYVIDFTKPTLFNKLVLYFGFPYIVDYQLDYLDAQNNWRTFYTGHTDFQFEGNPAYDRTDDYGPYSQYTDTKYISYYRKKGATGPDALATAVATYGGKQYMLIPQTIYTNTLNATKIRIRPINWQQDAKLYTVRVQYDSGALQLARNTTVADQTLYTPNGSFTSDVLFINKPADSLVYSTLSWEVGSGSRKEVTSSALANGGTRMFSFHDDPYRSGSTYSLISSLNGPFQGLNGIGASTTSAFASRGYPSVTYDKTCLFTSSSPTCVAHPAQFKSFWDDYFTGLDVIDSAGGREGGAERGAVPVVDAMRGQVGSFTGESFISANGTLPALDSFTLSLWVNPRAGYNGGQFNGEGLFSTLDERGDHNSRFTLSDHARGMQLSLEQNNHVYFVVGNGTGFNRISTSLAVPRGNWHQITARLVHDNLSLFIDGQLEAQGIVPGGYAPSVLDAFIGATHTDYVPPTTPSRGSPWLFYQGLMDDMRLYAVGLSDTEITALVQGTAPSSRLLSQWAFDESTWRMYGALIGHATIVEVLMSPSVSGTVPSFDRIEFDQLLDRVYKVVITPYIGPAETPPLLPYEHTLTNATTVHTVLDFPRMTAWGTWIAFYSYGNATTFPDQSPNMYNLKLLTTTSSSVSRPVSDFSVRLQLRSASSSTELASAPWMGPDGTDTTYFTTSGQQIPPVHVGKQYMQYKVFASTPSPSDTPLLKNVRIGYSGERAVLPTAVITSSATRITAGQPLLFLATGSVAGSSPLATYEWTFDDGTTNEGTAVGHIFDTPGEHSVKLTVTDSAGQVDTVWKDISVLTFDCLEPDTFGADTTLFPMTDPIVQVAARDAMREYADAHSIALASVDTPEEMYQAALDYLEKHMSYLPIPQRESCGSNGLLPRDGMSLPTMIRQSSQCGCPAGAAFCGVCRDYAVAFTTLVRAMGVNSKCVYGATTASLGGGLHAYNVVNYNGRFRIIEPQNSRLYKAFSSSALDWLNPDGVPFYLVGNVYNDKVGDYNDYRNSPASLGSAVAARIANNPGSAGVSNSTERCIATSYTNYSALRAQSGVWDSATLFQDVCPA